MTTTLHAVHGLVPGKRDRTNLRTLSDAMSFCLDQRAFGPRRLLLAFANRNGRFRGLAYTRRPDPPEAALAGCIEYLGRGRRPRSRSVTSRWRGVRLPMTWPRGSALARSIAASYGIHLVDWFACDDEVFRSSRFALDPDPERMVGCGLTRSGQVVLVFDLFPIDAGHRC